MLRWLLAGGGIVVVLMGLAAGCFLSSPWLTWHLLPTGSSRIVIDDDFPPVTWLQTQIVPSLAEDHEIFIGSAWDRVAYVTDHWSGPAALEALQTISWRRVPLRPVAIGELPHTFETPLFFAAVRQDTIVRILAAPRLEQLAQQPSLVMPSAAPDATAVLSLPGSALRTLPTSLESSWDALFHQKLHFLKTKPAIFTQLAAADHAVVLLQGDNLALGFQPGSQDMARLLNELVQNEERYTRPLEQAFRLPDGTIGRELVPGLPGDVFRERDATGCRAPLEGKTTLWLCEREGMVILATDQSLAHQLPEANAAQWQMYVDGSALPYLMEWGVRDITVLGGGAKILGEIGFQN